MKIGTRQGPRKMREYFTTGNEFSEAVPRFPKSSKHLNENEKSRNSSQETRDKKLHIDGLDDHDYSLV